eukprot:4693767-Alexandrium_andersonii.AAC.1
MRPPEACGRSAGVGGTCSCSHRLAGGWLSTFSEERRPSQAELQPSCLEPKCLEPKWLRNVVCGVWCVVCGVWCAVR